MKSRKSLWTLKVRVKIALFDDYGPGDMNEFTGDGTAGNLFRFASRQEAIIEGFECGIETGSGSGSHVKDFTQRRMTSAADGTLAAFGCAGVAGMGRQAGEGGGLLRGVTAGKAMGSDQQPGGRDWSNTGDGEEALGGLSPGMVAVQQGFDFIGQGLDVSL